MQQWFDLESTEFQQVAGGERARLLRLCAAITGDRDAAEDLVQEVLLEAWRHAGQLRDPAALPAWLTGIARNVCARWLRARGRSAATLAREAATLGTAAPADFELELERAEIATLLDRALALLPAATRDLLVQRYVAELPNDTIARQAGVSANLVAVRLHRGKLQLRQLLAHELRAEAESLGLIADDAGWSETRLWCSTCGQHRLQGSFDAEEFVLRCPGCAVEPAMFHSQASSTAMFDGVKGFRPAQKRFAAWMDDFFGRALTAERFPCQRCGRPVQLRRFLPDTAPAALRAQRGMHVRCTACGSGSYETLDGAVLNTPAGRRFWQAHPRIRLLPQREVEVDGRPALIVTFEALGADATLVGVLDRDSYQLRSVGEDRRGR